jgi:YVTN family beta-propeller protein
VSFVVTKTIDLTPPVNTVFQSVGLSPDGRHFFLVGEDIFTDPSKVLGKFGIVDLAAAVPSLATLSIPQLDHIRPARFLFAPDGKRLYLSQSNETGDLVFGAQVHALKTDRLMVFDPSTLPATPVFVAEISLPAADMHAMDLWITGPPASGSAKGAVVTNATPGVNGTASLINAATNTIAATIPVGRNPKQITVYYAGLAASDNQAMPAW